MKARKSRNNPTRPPITPAIIFGVLEADADLAGSVRSFVQCDATIRNTIGTRTVEERKRHLKMAPQQSPKRSLNSVKRKRLDWMMQTRWVLRRVQWDSERS